MFGAGDMYLPAPGSQSDASLPQGDDLFSTDGMQNQQSLMLDFEASPSMVPQNSASNPSQINSVKTTRPEISSKEIKIVDKPQRKITEIRIFYDDQTFDVFEPKKK